VRLPRPGRGAAPHRRGRRHDPHEGAPTSGGRARWVQRERGRVTRVARAGGWEGQGWAGSSRAEERNNAQ
jgi:hypothetical protein